ncbi:hypothetical protein [Actinophytocola sp.]|uniref:hypothetical protein n=1 Tax=Actinophytocola sp. TaxID=1872138 RepID=UPI002ED69B51
MKPPFVRGQRDENGVMKDALLARLPADVATAPRPQAVSGREAPETARQSTGPSRPSVDLGLNDMSASFRT